MFQELKALAVAAVVAGAMVASPAQADYVFSGSGLTGNLFPGAEPWEFNAHGSNSWGSPGVGNGTTPYSHPLAAYGFDISFTGGGTIVPEEVTIGNGAACTGGPSGGTTFCTISPTDIWIATITGPSSIAFRAQDSNFFISQGQDYFVNIMLTGGTPTSFEGRWLTEFTPSVPEPASMALFGVALAGIAAARRRRAA